MVAFYILGALVLLIVAILFIRVGIHAAFGEELRVSVKIGPIKKQMIPKPDKPEKKKKKKKKEDEKPEEESGKPKEEKKKEKKLDLTVDEILSAFPALFESLKGGLRKAGKRIRIKPFNLSVIFGGDDPANVAQMYGKASAAMWTAMPQLERLVHISDPRIHLDVDYNALKTNAEGEIGASFQIRDILGTLWKFGRPVLKWYLPIRKKKATQKRAEDKQNNEQVKHKGE